MVKIGNINNENRRHPKTSYNLSLKNAVRIANFIVAHYLSIRTYPEHKEN